MREDGQMSISDKLRLMEEISKRNDERCKRFAKEQKMAKAVS